MTLEDFVNRGLAAQRAVDALTPRVHFLLAGHALCELRGVPADWPAGHSWVRLGEPGVTCEACRQRASDPRR